ncbi:hypothetical protein [Enterococcus gilvus]
MGAGAEDELLGGSGSLLVGGGAIVDDSETLECAVLLDGLVV